MKRIWALFLAFCTVTLSCVCMLAPGATGTDTDIWSVYSMMGDEDGNIFFGTAPSFAYTDEGLRVVPFEGIGSYTVQTDHAYNMDDGLYMEIKLDRPAEAGMLVFHLWDQSGFLLSGLNCGSGWQGMLQLNPSESQHMVSTFVRGATSEEEGQAIVMGSAKVSVPVAEDGSVCYSLYLNGDVLQINGCSVAGMEKSLTMLREKSHDGRVHLGVSVAMSEMGGQIPITVTRFGASPEDATVPGTGGQLPETGASDPEAIPFAPSETNDPVDRETDPTDPGSKPDGGEPDAPVETAPNGEIGRPDSVDTADGETYDPYGDPETESETRKEIHNEKVDDFISKLEGCTSAIGIGAVGFTIVLAAAFLGLHKKD